MNHRSVIAALFADYVRRDSAGLELQDIAALVAPFGISRDALRVIMSRLRREGWCTTSRRSSRTVYRPTDEAWAALEQDRAHLLNRAPSDWSGEWRVVMYDVAEPDRAVREQMRRTLISLGFGPLGGSTWLSPHDRLEPVLALARREPAIQVDVLIARSQGPEQDKEFVARCWALDEVNCGYCDFLAEYESAVTQRRARRLTSEQALVMRVGVTEDYRARLAADPELPSDLLPPGWLGAEAFEVFSGLYRDLGPRASQYYRDVVRGAAGEAPAI